MPSSPVPRVRSLSAAAAILSLSIALACGGGDSTGPQETRWISAAGDRTTSGLPKVAIWESPLVKVGTGISVPLPGVVVTFTASDGGRVSNATATTDNNGVASPGVWTLGDAEGVQTLTASIVGAAPTRLQVGVRRPFVGVRRYDLLTWGGQMLPITSSTAGVKSTMLRGHLTLMDDGTYVRSEVVSTTVSGTAQVDSTLFIGRWRPDGTAPVTSLLEIQEGPSFNFGAWISDESLKWGYDFDTDEYLQVYVRAP